MQRDPEEEGWLVGDALHAENQTHATRRPAPNCAHPKACSCCLAIVNTCTGMSENVQCRGEVAVMSYRPTQLLCHPWQQHERCCYFSAQAGISDDSNGIRGIKHKQYIKPEILPVWVELQHQRTVCCFYVRLTCTARHAQLTPGIQHYHGIFLSASVSNHMYLV